MATLAKHAASALALLLLTACVGEAGSPEDVAQSPTGGSSLAPDAEGVFHVHPGEEIQPALDAAADHPSSKTVRVHEGVYRPSSSGQALIWLNARHDGITLEAAGEVTLTAANPELADPSAPSFPAIVNHVVYFGDGISRDTVLRGFHITGANGFASRSEARGPIEPNQGLKKGLFFYLDGGAIKIFGRSYPTIVGNRIHDNATSLCGGGISVEHMGFDDSAVLIKDSIFENNRVPATGSAVDVLSGSAAIIENCLFVGNVGNTRMDRIAQEYGLRYNWQHGSGALTVFPDSRVEIRRSTFVSNWNGADDKGTGSIYSNTIFWRNDASDGSRPGGPYELDILDASQVRGCFLNGATADLQGTIDSEANDLEAPDPQFDTEYRPQSESYAGVGYRPVASETAPGRME